MQCRIYKTFSYFSRLFTEQRLEKNDEKLGQVSRFTILKVEDEFRGTEYGLSYTTIKRF